MVIRCRVRALLQHALRELIGMVEAPLVRQSTFATVSLECDIRQIAYRRPAEN
jgi:hypothetical protein